jgi:hypothetical protein
VTFPTTHFLAPVISARPASFCGLDGLAIDDRCAGGRCATLTLTDPIPEESCAMPPRPHGAAKDDGSDRPSATEANHEASLARQCRPAGRKKSRPGSLETTISEGVLRRLLEDEGEKNVPLGVCQIVRIGRSGHGRITSAQSSTFVDAGKTCISTFFRRTLSPSPPLSSHV